MKVSPLIGITVSIDHGKMIRANYDYFYIKRAYAQAVRKAGGQPILISPDISPEVAATICDGIVISGGDDVPPNLYGERTASKIYPESEQRIEWERKLLDLTGVSAKPVLGVCYGLQLINVHFGGSLHQDIVENSDAPVDHGGRGKVTHHSLNVMKGSFLYPLFGPNIEVSSAHHQ